MQINSKSDISDFSVWNNYLKSIIELYQLLFINGKVKAAYKLFKRTKPIIDQEYCPKITKAKFFAYYGKLRVYTIFFLSNPIPCSPEIVPPRATAASCNSCLVCDNFSDHSVSDNVSFSNIKCTFPSPACPKP